MLRIFNTLSEKKEKLAISKNRPVRLFVCGPTVYDYPHIGNARTFMAFDIIVRYLRSEGYNIFYLQNITDIDDKIIIKAKEEKTSWKATAKKYEKIFYRNLKDLNITSVDKFARATDYIPEILKQVKTLIKKKYAYKIPGDGWYFDLKTFPDYGKLAHRTVGQAEDGVSRIDASDKKRNAGDFALWKFSHTNSTPPPKGSDNAKAPMRIYEPSWPTDLGDGRPGWHIEDTAISESFFGSQYDLHGGALDLKFPHHEAEIAQQESASGKKPFVKIWMHAGFLEVNGQKMSKSLGNFITINSLLKKYSADIFRMIILAHHYRSPINYTENSAKQAKTELQNLNNFIVRLSLIKKRGILSRALKISIKKTDSAFQIAMEDDFNTPDALAAIFQLTHEIEPRLWSLNQTEAKTVKNLITQKMGVFGINFQKIEKNPLKIKQLAKERELYRTNKQFTQADALRKKIEKLGYHIEDTPVGPLILKK